MTDNTPAPRPRPTGLRDPVVRMIVTHWALGAGVGALAAGLVLVFDIGHIRTLLVRSDAEIAGIVLLFTGFAVTFGSVVAATAAMFDPVRGRRGVEDDD